MRVKRQLGKKYSPAQRACAFISSLYGDRGETVCLLIKNITYVLLGVAPAALIFGAVGFVSAAVCALSGGAGIGYFMRCGIAGISAAALLPLLALLLISAVKTGENTALLAREAAPRPRRKMRAAAVRVRAPSAHRTPRQKRNCRRRAR